MSGRAPSSLRIARVLLWVQAVGSVLITVVDWANINELRAHGEEVPGMDSFVSIVAIPVCALMVVCAMFITSRQRWVRPLAIGVEVVGAANATGNVISGYPQGLVAVAIAGWVIAQLCRREVGFWLDGVRP